MKFEIGSKLVLVNRTPYGFFGHNEKPVKFITVEIIELRNTGTCEYTGKAIEALCALAKGSDDYLYGYNWKTVGGGFSDTPWVRYIPNEDFQTLSEFEKDIFVKDYIWHDVTGWQCPPVPKLVEMYPFLHYCDKHQQLYYTECDYCGLNLSKREIELNQEEHSWVGWY